MTGVAAAGIFVTQSKRQMLNTDFTHVERLSLWTRQLHRGVALAIDLTGMAMSSITSRRSEALSAWLSSFMACSLRQRVLSQGRLTQNPAAWSAASTHASASNT